MITGIVLVLISVFSFYLIHRTDLENDAIGEGNSSLEKDRRVYAHIAIIILFIIGVVSIVNDITP